MAGASAVQGVLLRRPRTASAATRLLTAPVVRRVVAGTWSIYWNGLADGARPRPSAWAANNFFSNANGEANPEFFYWLWGGSAGGPIKRDKTFFWASNEGYHTGTVWTRVLTVPTLLQRAGDFSQTFDSNGNLVKIYDPLTTCGRLGNPPCAIDPKTGSEIITRQQFPDNKIPAARMNATGLALMKFFPDPKRPGDASGRDNFPASDVLLDNTHQVTGKLDHTFNSKHSISGSYAWYQSREPFAVFFRGTVGELADATNYKLFRDVHMPTVNYTMIPSATSVLNVRYGYYYWRDSCVAASNGFDLAKLGFDPNFVKSAPAKTFPGFDVEGLISPPNANDDYVIGGQGDNDVFWKSHTFVVNYSKSIARHSIKFGGAYRVIGVDFTDRIGSSGGFAFSKTFTQRDPTNLDPIPSGNGIASLLLGYPDSGSILTAAPLRFFTRYYSGYVHDDFRLTPNLTLNAGLRYEYETDLGERDNQITVGFDRTAKNPLADKITDAALRDRIRGGLLYAGAGGNKEHQGDPQKTKFQPRVGFAWRATPKTVLRGGYGIFYAPLPLFFTPTRSSRIRWSD